MQVHENYEILGLISIVWLWMCLWFMIWHWRGNTTMTYSSHAAQTKQGIVYYFLTFSTHLVLFTVFAVTWLVPTLNVPRVFLPLLFCAVAGQEIALLIPSTGGKMTIVHDAMAYFMHFLLTPLALLVVFYSNVPALTKVLATAPLFSMLGVLFVFIRYKDSNKHALYLQTAYGLSFHIVILLVMYLR